MITHSLLSSWLYAMRDNPYADAETEPEDPLADFRKVLNREPTEPTEAMEKGKQFEDLVTKITEKSANAADFNDPWYNAASKIAEIIDGGLLQVKCGKTVCINGMNIFLYGRLDALKAGNIYDIKYAGKYDRGKFFKSTQHPMYMELVPDAQAFSYLVSNGSDVWTETYRKDEAKSIFPIIEDFLDWLTAANLIEVYKSKWLAL